jgi:hypothetical protein
MRQQRKETAFLRSRDQDSDEVAVSISVNSKGHILDIEGENMKRDHWDDLCKRYCLTESFIRKYQNEVTWVLVAIWQEMSFEFIKEFQNKLDFPTLIIMNSIISSDAKEQAVKLWQEKEYMANFNKLLDEEYFSLENGKKL